MSKKNTETTQLQDFTDYLSKISWGRTKPEAQENKICVQCGKPAASFKNNLSKSEYEISGLCQECQDKIFL